MIHAISAEELEALQETYVHYTKLAKSKLRTSIFFFLIISALGLYLKKLSVWNSFFLCICIICLDAWAYYPFFKRVRLFKKDLHSKEKHIDLLQIKKIKKEKHSHKITLTKEITFTDYDNLDFKKGEMIKVEYTPHAKYVLHFEKAEDLSSCSS